MSTTSSRTYLAFQHDGKLCHIKTTVKAIYPFSALEETSHLLHKQGTDQDHVVVTEQTIFHPQGGGQPSDIGRMSNFAGVSFDVAAVRMNPIQDGQVLHFGRFLLPSIFEVGDEVDQAIDVEKRLLYSRYHTAGHVLGAAVRYLVQNEIPGFDELKASHFPDSAACEFQGAIDGKWKDPIQKKVDEYISTKMKVEIDWWDEDDFKKHGLERLMPDKSLIPEGDKFRVVNIVGAEVYPCGGTHVNFTDECVTRSYKANDRDHVGLANGSASQEEHLPRYFAKNGALDSDPKSVKKEGNGRGGWGSAGTEAQDYGYKFHQSHRHSNSSANAELVDFKTKFEFNDEPVFEESIHGPREEDDDTAESNSAVSLDEETESKQA